MCAHVVVVLAPRFDPSSGILDVEEPMLVQTFRTEPAVESFAVGILRWFPGSREVEDSAVGVGPEIHLLRCELAAIVQSDPLWTAELGKCGCESIDGIGSLGLTSDPDPWAHTAKAIDYGQDPDAAAVEQLVVHPIHRPAVVRGRGWPAILAPLGADPATRRLVPHLQFLQFVQPIDPLGVDRPACR